MARKSFERTFSPSAEEVADRPTVVVEAGPHRTAPSPNVADDGDVGLFQQRPQRIVVGVASGDDAAWKVSSGPGSPYTPPRRLAVRLSMVRAGSAHGTAATASSRGVVAAEGSHRSVQRVRPAVQQVEVTHAGELRRGRTSGTPAAPRNPSASSTREALSQDRTHRSPYHPLVLQQGGTWSPSSTSDGVAAGRCSRPRPRLASANAPAPPKREWSQAAPSWPRRRTAPKPPPGAP